MKFEKMKIGQYNVTIGLEVHVALKTQSKLFSRSYNGFDEATFALLDAGVPGVLPVISDTPVKMACAFALAVGAQIKPVSLFERKHYFYPDLPLGYQITQQHQPIMVGGEIKVGDRNILIEHAHLECDAAKSIHTVFPTYTAIDLSRCASPLLEIVSMPCMHSPAEAREYAKAIHALVVFMGICDGKMEEGSFRVDASISLSKDETRLGTRVEIKNISSFSFLESALMYEIQRQYEILSQDGSLVMETRLFNELDMATHSMRTKETVDEYRYMPDPDIAPLIIDEGFIQEVLNQFDTHYFEYRSKLQDLVSSEIDATSLLLSKQKLLWLEVLKDKSLHDERSLKMLAFWLPEVLAKEKDEDMRSLRAQDLKILSLSSLQAKEIKEVILTWMKGDKDIKEYFPQFMNEEQLKNLVKETLLSYSEQIIKYKSGDVKIIQFLVGKVMAQVKSQAPASRVKEEVINFCNM